MKNLTPRTLQITAEPTTRDEALIEVAKAYGQHEITDGAALALLREILTSTDHHTPALASLTRGEPADLTACLDDLYTARQLTNPVGPQARAMDLLGTWLINHPTL